MVLIRAVILATFCSISVSAASSLSRRAFASVIAVCSLSLVPSGYCPAPVPSVTESRSVCA
ncbi:hypothetical protein HFN12_13370 [Faecalicatena fissicatena]|nr:hypothetical protein [Faecalicatena fissicatena]